MTPKTWGRPFDHSGDPTRRGSSPRSHDGGGAGVGPPGAVADRSPSGTLLAGDIHRSLRADPSNGEADRLGSYAPLASMLGLPRCARRIVDGGGELLHADAPARRSRWFQR